MLLLHVVVVLVGVVVAVVMYCMCVACGMLYVVTICCILLHVICCIWLHVVACCREQEAVGHLRSHPPVLLVRHLETCGGVGRHQLCGFRGVACRGGDTHGSKTHAWF